MATRKPAKKAPKSKKPEKKNKGGRPSKFTQALIDTICERLSKGEPLAVICRDKGMPDPSTVWDWQQASESVSQALARAREAGEVSIEAELLEIADDARNDFMEKQNADGSTYEALNAEHIQRSKLRIETRFKLLKIWNPKKYGDRQTIEHDVTGNLAEELKAARERASNR